MAHQGLRCSGGAGGAPKRSSTAIAVLLSPLILAWVLKHPPVKGLGPSLIHAPFVLCQAANCNGGFQHQLPTGLSLFWHLAWEGKRGRAVGDMCGNANLQEGCGEQKLSLPFAVLLRALCCSALLLEKAPELFHQGLSPCFKNASLLST